jgi:hypothetical protein
VTIAHELALRPQVEGSVPAASRSAALRSQSLRHTASLFSSIASSPSPSGLSVVGPFPLTLFFPLHAVAWPTTPLFPLHTQKQGGATHPKMSARRHFHALLLPEDSLGSLSFQLLAHSFIFRITPISHSSNIFPTLHQKTRVYPPPVQPIPPKHLTHTPLILGPRSPLPPVASHQSRVTLSSPTNLSVAPTLPPAGHWYLRSGATQVREEEAKT